jgi:hypothetical protein
LGGWISRSPETNELSHATQNAALHPAQHAAYHAAGHAALDAAFHPLLVTLHAVRLRLRLLGQVRLNRVLGLLDRLFDLGLRL